MKRIQSILIILFSTMLLLVRPDGMAQEVSLTQFFNAPLFLNPGFAGSTPEFRATLNSRVQWPSIDNPFVTQTASLDYNMFNFNSGLGAYITVDDVGPLTTVSVNGIYSYKININSKWVISPGLQFGYVNRNPNLDRYLFYSDIVSGQTDEELQNGADLRSNYFDFGAGLVMFNRSFWWGFSVKHLNRPLVSTTDQVENLEAEWSVHGGWRIKLPQSLRSDRPNTVLLPSFIYRNRGVYDQLELGLQTQIDPLVFGLVYKGISFQQVNGLENNDVLALLAGFAAERIEIGYSYDFYLGGIGSRSGGAHEFALIYQFRAINWDKKKKKRSRQMMNTVPPFYREKWWKLDPSN